MANERVFDWHAGKAASNLASHGVSFEAVHDFRFDAALIVPDDRHDYGEVRMVATSVVQSRVHVLVYTERREVTWVISLRKANKREVGRYARYLKGEV